MKSTRRRHCCEQAISAGGASSIAVASSRTGTTPAHAASWNWTPTVSAHDANLVAIRLWLGRKSPFGFHAVHPVMAAEARHGSLDVAPSGATERAPVENVKTPRHPRLPAASTGSGSS
jgi:hypothetical protein